MAVSFSAVEMLKSKISYSAQRLLRDLNFTGGNSLFLRFHQNHQDLAQAWVRRSEQPDVCLTVEQINKLLVEPMTVAELADRRLLDTSQVQRDLSNLLFFAVQQSAPDYSFPDYSFDGLRNLGQEIESAKPAKVSGRRP